MKRRTHCAVVTWTLFLVMAGFFCGGFAEAQSPQPSPPSNDDGPSPQAAFSSPGRFSARDLYKMAHEAFKAGDLPAARLYAIRVFFDGHRSVNLLNLLGAVELKAGNDLLATEWLMKSLCLDSQNSVARKILARLPGRPTPIPVDPLRIHEHFTGITKKLPKLLEQLVSPKLYTATIFKELSRGKFYKGLALAEEYEKKYPGVDGQSMTALCAWYLGRHKDARQILDQGLVKSPFHPTLLFIRAMLDDTDVMTSAPSRFRALYDQDRWQEALDASKKFSSQFPRFADGYLLRARIALDLLRPKEAATALAQAQKRDPGSPEIELLNTELAFIEGNATAAEDALRRALRRGYHLPSVNLAAGLIAAANNRLSEATAILQDAKNSLPFSDRAAWSFYIQLALRLDKFQDAGQALDLWRNRGPLSSEVCLLQGIYGFRIGENQNALAWIRKGFSRNPNRIAMLKEMLAFPGMTEDPDLVGKIRAKLTAAGVKGFAGPAPAASPPVAPAAVSGKPPAAKATPTPSVDGIFQIGVNAEGGPEIRKELEALLAEINSRLEPVLGRLTSPVYVNFVPAAGMGSQVAMFDADTNGLIITQLVFDVDTLKAYVQAEKPWLPEEEATKVAIGQPRHQVARELATIMILRHLPNPTASMEKAAWLQHGLAEVLAGGEDVLSARLKTVQKAIEEKKIELKDLSKINETFSEGYSSPVILEAAYAQAYLMTSFLMKREGTKGEGVKRVLDLMRALGDGTPLERALKATFKVEIGDFESGWKQAAYWSLKQGTPYQW